MIHCCPSPAKDNLPIEFLVDKPSWLSLEDAGLASRHFWYLSLQAASIVLHSGPAVGSQWNTWHMKVFWKQETGKNLEELKCF